jgi:hypothetical protein
MSRSAIATGAPPLWKIYNKTNPDEFWQLAVDDFINQNTLTLFSSVPGSQFSVTTSNEGTLEEFVFLLDNNGVTTLPGPAVIRNVDLPTSTWTLAARELGGQNDNSLILASNVDFSSFTVQTKTQAGLISNFTIDSEGNVLVEGDVVMGGNKVTGLAIPTADDDAATKKYVDDMAGGGAVWGGITGTLSDQTDLQSALDAKFNSSGGTISGPVTITDNMIVQGATVTLSGDATANSFAAIGSFTSGAVAGAGFFMNAAQPTAANSATRKDYVDAQIATRAPASAVDTATWGSISGTLSSQTDLQSALNAKFNATGGTISGPVTITDNLIVQGATVTLSGDATANSFAAIGSFTSGAVAGAGFFMNAAQPTAANSATRKDYVDAQIATRQPAGSYASLTANQTFSGSNTFSATVTFNGATSISASGTISTFGNMTATGSFTSGSVAGSGFFMSGAQPSAVNSATRKDYVDGQIATRAPSSAVNTATWGSIAGTLSNQTDLQNALNAKLNTGLAALLTAQNTFTGQTNAFKDVNCAGTMNAFAVVSSVGNVTSANQVVISGAQGLAANVATRKDYVDAAVSDARAKRMIGGLGDVSWLHDLTVSKYTFNDAYDLPKMKPSFRDGVHFGVIAQDVVKVCPEAVYTSPHREELMAVDWEMISAAMLKEIQNLRSELNALVDRS